MIFPHLVLHFFFLTRLSCDLTFQRRNCNPFNIVSSSEHDAEMKNAVSSAKTSKHQSSWKLCIHAIDSTTARIPQSCKNYLPTFGMKKNNENKFKWISSFFHCELALKRDFCVCNVHPTCHPHSANQMHYFQLLLLLLLLNRIESSANARSSDDAGLQRRTIDGRKQELHTTIYIL